MHLTDTSSRVVRDLVFADRPGGPLLLDLYLPAPTPHPAPVVLWLHGGGWFTGDRSLAPDLERHFVSRGFAMASAEYRLSGAAVFPAQLHDVRAAIRWLRGHADEYGLDRHRIGVWGASAGGHLAALAGVTGHVDRLPGEPGGGNASVVAVAESYGPVDILGRDVPPGGALPGADPSRSPEARLLGGLPAAVPDLARLASPRSHVTSVAPPFQISHGTADALVPARHSELLHRALLDAGVESDLYLVDDHRHGFLNPAGRLDVALAAVMDDGRLDEHGPAPATLHDSRGDTRRTAFGFDTIGEFFARHLTHQPDPETPA